MKKKKNKTLTFIIGNIGCVDKDTEFFTGLAWKKISEYKFGDSTLQYNKDGTAELVFPLEYIKTPSLTFNHIQTKYGVDMCFCDNHNHIYVDFRKPDKLLRISSQELINRHQKNINGFSGRFITTFKREGTGIIELTDNEIRLMIAVIADGTFNSNTTHCIINIKKDRKKIRLAQLLQNCKTKYTRIDKITGYSVFKFYAPIRQKIFVPDYWYRASEKQLNIIAEECLKWDGTEKNGRKAFFTTNKTSADFIQYVFTVTGHRASLVIQNRVGQDYRTSNKIYKRKSIEYQVTCIKNKFSTLLYAGKNTKCKIKQINSEDGLKYCFKVPSNMLVLRRNGFIFITGNSGKTTWVRQNRGNRMVVSPDQFRYAIGGGSYIFKSEYEPVIEDLNILAMKSFLNIGVDIILDKMNVSKQQRKRFINLGKQYGYKIIAIVLPQISKRKSVNRRMDNPHGQYSRRLWNRVWENFNNVYETPTIKEGFDEVIFL